MERPLLKLAPRCPLIIGANVSIIIRIAIDILSRLGLSTEVESTWETLRTRATTITATAKALCAAEGGTAVHHTEEDLRVDAAAHTTTHATAIHVGGVN